MGAWGTNATEISKKGSKKFLFSFCSLYTTYNIVKQYHTSAVFPKYQHNKNFNIDSTIFNKLVKWMIQCKEI